MDKKQHDRRPDERSAEHGSGKHDPNRPEPGRTAPGSPGGDKGFGKAGGQRVDKPLPSPGMGGGRKDILDSERSDRESGRPVQLEDDDEMESIPGGADAKPGLGGRPHEGREGQKPYEGEKRTR